MLFLILDARVTKYPLFGREKENTRARGLTVPLKGHTILALEEENV